jgi:hypothetical protein
MQIQVTFTEALVKRTVRRFWTRLIGWHGFAIVAFLAVVIAYLLAVGDSSWLVPALGTLLGIAVLVGSSVYFVYRHRALSTLRRMAQPTALVTFTDTGVATRSDLGGGDVSWRAITQVWKFPEVWLLFVAKGTYFMIPTEALADDVRKFICDKVREHGGKVV